MTGDYKTGSDPIPKSPVYSPLGSSAHEVSVDGSTLLCKHLTHMSGAERSLES